MQPKTVRVLLTSATIALLVSLTGTVVLAANTAAIDSQVSETLKLFYSLSDQNKYLADNAAGVLVFPTITKAGVGLGGEHGDGALLEKGKTVGYYSLSGASIGATLGVSKHSQVILFNSSDALNKFVNGSRWEVGADTSVAVAKTGAGGTYDKQTLSKPVLAFVFGENGLMADASLEGTTIKKIQ